MKPLSTPQWVTQLCPAPSTPMQLVSNNQWSRITAIVPNAVAMHAEQLQQAVEQAYTELLQHIRRSTNLYPVRFWNGIPQLLCHLTPTAHEQQLWDEQCPQHLPFDRYMAFNRGRSEAMQHTAKDGLDLTKIMAAASGVGCGGNDVYIHALSHREPGHSFENPRQIPAWQYSGKYGPIAPTFARATQINQLLFISGTASVVGEDTLHPNNLVAQTDETFKNIKSLLGDSPYDVQDIQHARVYYSNEQQQQLAHDSTKKHLPKTTIEMVHATICRNGLVIEIEGICGL